MPSTGESHIIFNGSLVNNCTININDNDLIIVILTVIEINIVTQMMIITIIGMMIISHDFGQIINN
jgi:hypothetical protein